MRPIAALLIIVGLLASGCALGGSVAVSVGPKFLGDTTAWSATVEVAPVTYLEPSGLPSERFGGQQESTYASGIALRGFGTAAFAADQWVAGPGVGLGFNPYMLVRPDGQPAFDSHMGFQVARIFGGSNGPEFGPHVTMAFRAFSAGGSAGIVGGGLDCLIARDGLGCGPVAKLQIMRTSKFEP
jgi:hypothetical protein